jgi:hypothetical protein
MKLSLTFFHDAFFNMTDTLGLARVEEADEELPLDKRTRGQAYGMESMLHRDLTRRLGGVSFIASTSASKSALRDSARSGRPTAIGVARERSHPQQELVRGKER